MTIPKEESAVSFPNTIAEAGAALRRGEFKPRDLVDRCLARIDALEERVRAWVVVDRDGARRAADHAARELADGYDRGPMHGIPIGIKDIVDVAGLPTLAGARVRPSTPAARDAFVVTRLREDGAIVLGKTVTTEFASFDPPPTRNPWNPERTPGGSSSGSAAAVACGMCFAAVGSQTGGSIIRPASYCGVAGFKPTWGRVSLAGIVPLAYHLDHPGPIARTVADLHAAYHAMRGFDGADPIARTSAPSPGDVGGPKQIGVVRGFFAERAMPTVRDNVAAAVERLRAGGLEVIDVTLPESFADVVRSHRMVMAVEAAAYHRETFAARRAEYGPRIAVLLDEGLAATSTDYSRALSLQLKFRRDMERLIDETGVDGLVMPSVSNTAPAADSTGEPSFQAPWSFAGLPVVSMPCALGDDGLPVCVQIVGQAWCEERLFATAAECEQAIAWRERPAMVRGVE
jgi:aspartyl-tRNA(Asn)/glutamyl-tRNA(Gln) amidotransferase subunit A